MPRLKTFLGLPIALVLGLVLAGVVLTATVVPGVFIVDDNNYLVTVLALRHQRLTIANTEGLPPSRELLFFDPSPWSRSVTSTPVTSVAPPLYAPLALPFASFGWRGLVALNTLSFLVTIALVFVYARRYATSDRTAWITAVACGACGFFIEYAQGLWPHMLAVVLCTAGIMTAGRVIDGGTTRFAIASGALLGLAAGIRYQNAVLVGAVLASLALWASARLARTAAFSCAAALPLAASSFVNHLRIGSWNPISKGPGYLAVGAVSNPAGSWLDSLKMPWAMLVDFSVRPRLAGPNIDAWLTYDPTTGVHLIFGTFAKKALLQSIPWAALALVLFAIAWTSRVGMPDARRRQLRFLSLVTLAPLVAFSLAGSARHDGLSFNARYLLEIVPVLAVAFAWALDGVRLPSRLLAPGVALGAVLVIALVLGTPVEGGPDSPLWLARQIAFMKLPLLLAVMTTAAWLRVHFSGRGAALLVFMIGVTLSWAAILHLSTDVVPSRAFRALERSRTETLAATLPDHSALVAYWSRVNAAVPLLFDRDIVLLDAHPDDGADAPMLIRDLLSKNRPVFVILDSFPNDVIDRVLTGFSLRPIEAPGMRLAAVSLAP